MVERPDGSLISAKEISDAIGTPSEVTAKILQTLSSAKFLQSEKGLQGGYKLTAELANISLHQLIEVMEGPSGLVKCIQDEHACDIQGLCNIASPLAVLNTKVQNFYRAISIAELLYPNLTAQPIATSETKEVNT